jgi:hypothetical protein
MPRALHSLSLITLLGCAMPAHAVNITQQSADAIVRVYSTAVFQDDILLKFTTQYPDLSADATRVRAEFHSRFPEFDAQVLAILTRITNPEQAALDKQKIVLNAHVAADKQNLSHAQAKTLVQMFDDFNHGVPGTDPEFQGYLLAITYDDHPENELRDHFIQPFITDGKGTSQGIKLQMNVPLSWQPYTSKDAGSIADWKSEHGTGNAALSISISPLKTPISATEFDSMMTAQTLKRKFGTTLVPTNLSGKTTIGQQPAYWFELRSTKNNKAYKHDLAMLSYIIWVQGKLVSINCGTGGAKNSAADVDVGFARIKPLCQLIAESLTFDQPNTGNAP